MAKTDLKPIEEQAILTCSIIQKNCKTLGKNLTEDIRENASHLVKLFECRRALDFLQNVLPQHEVIDNNTGKSLGFLYDNDYIEGVMMATGIQVNSAIQHTEWHMGLICRNKYLI